MKENTLNSNIGSDAITQEDVDAAILRGAKRPSVPVVAFEVVAGEPYKLRFVMENGSALQVEVNLYEEFSGLTLQELNTLYLSMGGQALCADDLDLHVSIQGLLRDAGAKRIGFLADFLTVPHSRRV